MALTATFQADFESFFAAVQKAEVSLKSFEGNANKVGSSLNRMVDNFSGRKMIQDATLMATAVEKIGGVSKLTETQLMRVGAQAQEAISKMKLMGVDVPPGLQKIADAAHGVDKAHRTLGSTVKDLALGFAALFTVRAAANFAKDIINQASVLKDLAQQTHINVEELQLLAGAMSEFGVDADTLGKGLFTLSRKIAGGDESVQRALHMMGMSLKDVEGLQGEKLFLKIEHGLATLQGSLRDTAASDLFGSRLGMAMAGAAEGIDTALERTRRLNTVMSKESVDAMDEYGEAIDRTQRSLSAFAGNMIGPVAQGFNVLTDAAEKGATKWGIFWAALKDANATMVLGMPVTAFQTKLLDDLNKKTEAVAAATRKASGASSERVVILTAEQQASKFLASLQADASITLTAAQVKNLTHLKAINALNADNAAAIGVNRSQYDKYTESLKASGEASKTIKKAQDEIADAIAKTKAAVVPLTAATKAQVLEWNKSNISVALMATQLRISDIAIKTYLDSVEKATAGQKKFEESVKTFGNVAIQSVAPLAKFSDVIDGVYQHDLPHLSYELMASQVQLDMLGNTVNVKLVPSLEKLGGALYQQGLQARVSSEQVNVFDQSLDRLATSFVQLAQASDGAMGEIARDIGRVITSMQLGTEAAKSMTAGFTQINDGSKAEGFVTLAAGIMTAVAALDAATNSTSRFKNVMGGAATGAKMGASVGGGAGAIVGAGIGALVGWAKSNSMEGRTVSPIRDEFFKLAGGLEKLNPLLLHFSGNMRLVEKLFKAKTIDEYNAALVDLQSELGRIEQLTKDITDAHVELAGKMGGLLSLTPEMEEAFARAYDTQTPEDFLGALNDINLVLDDAKKKHNDMTEAAGRYGITIDGMGKAWQAQELNEKAQSLFKDYELLTKGGADHIAVVKGMGKSVDDYLDKARKMGIEVPSSMKPMIQTFIDAGELTDDQGKKIKDLEGIGVKFGDTMEVSMGKVATALERLITILETRLGPAIQNVPDGDFTMRGKVVMPDKLPQGYKVPDFPDEPRLMAAGGRGVVNKPTMFMAGEAGSEEFAFSGANKRFSGASLDLSATNALLTSMKRAQEQSDRELPFVLVMALKDAQAH